MTYKIRYYIIFYKSNKKELEILEKKTINLDSETIKKVEELARENQRDFSKQVRFIINEYLKIIEKK